MAGMSAPPTSASGLPTPRDLGIEDFGHYALVIDARSPHEYDEDHIPGAVNLPVVDDREFAEVGTLHRNSPHDAYLVGASYALKNLSRQLADVVSRFKPTDRMLVYCFRGGKRSKVWADNLRTVGFPVDVLPGGWKNYRRWVRASLETLPYRFDYRVLAGSTGCGKTRLLQALSRVGAQALDLEGLAVHRGSLIGQVPGQAQPTQKQFDSRLLDAMRALDPARPVWIEAESKKIGALQIPEALYQAMRRKPPLQISAPMEARVRVCREDYAHFAADPQSMVALLAPLKPLIGGQELAHWQQLADAGDADALFERVMAHHYDPCYERSNRSGFGEAAARETLELQDLTPEGLLSVARELANQA
jgi:tRNA 2-selenouridine synthase